MNFFVSRFQFLKKDDSPRHNSWNTIHFSDLLNLHNKEKQFSCKHENFSPHFLDFVPYPERGQLLHDFIVPTAYEYIW